MERGPILVLGIAQRVGTGYLRRLIAAHPECTDPTALREDSLVTGLAHLGDYVDSVSARWEESWGARARTPELRRLLGAALVAFLRSDAQDSALRPVVKTPSVRGLELVSEFLPQCKVIVLARYGPDVVESGMQSFGWKFEKACRKWGEAAQSVVALRDRHAGVLPQPFFLVRYEDLIEAPEPTLRSLFAFAGLEGDAFDYKQVDTLPIRGSSVDRGGAQEVHWLPVEKPPDFNPVGRSRDWSAQAFRRFDSLTGSISQRLGYEVPGASYSGPRRSVERVVRRVRGWLG